MEHQIIIERFCSCMDLLDFIKIVGQISLTRPAKLIRVTWRRLRMQILMWELEGLDPQYVVPTDIYPIHYQNFIQEELEVSFRCYYYQEYSENYFLFYRNMQQLQLSIALEIYLSFLLSKEAHYILSPPVATEPK